MAGKLVLVYDEGSLATDFPALGLIIEVRRIFAEKAYFFSGTHVVLALS